jgi:hypothetical protein
MLPNKIIPAVLVCLFCAASALAQESKPSNLTPAQNNDKAPVITEETLPSGARIYLAPMPNGFETYVAAGLEKKKVPVVVVIDRDKADYELSRVSDTDRTGWAKMLFLGSQQTNETASIKIVNLKTGNVVFAYSVNKTNSVRWQTKCGRGRRQAHQREDREPVPLTCPMKTSAIVLSIVLIVLIGFSPAAGQATANKVIPPKAKVFIAAMPTASTCI